MSKEKFYMTTAIAYTSGKPHIGNTYEIVLADSIARFKRQMGYDVFFQTGTDEHGMKIEEKAKDAGITVVVSNHDFEKTPAKKELIRRMEKMIEINADIPKIAVMPNSNRDVLELLDVTDTIHQKYPDVPIITMSMEGRGIVSRVCGEIFGSCVTFGCARKASAPGQIEADDLERAIKIIHENLYHKDEFENMQ